ncbi:MAG: nuclear transport factor 2 family protein [Acidobacteria bacterium]|nr:MAG: nuclear transport factor 2 family protein [Acidobacteriota bacterium]
MSKSPPDALIPEDAMSPESTRGGESSRHHFVNLVTRYFEAVDAKDVDGTLACFNDDAILIVQTDHRRYEGKSAIREMFVGLYEDTDEMTHRVVNWVVDPAANACATEQIYRGKLKDGSLYDMHNCNFFEFRGGKFQRVTIFLSGASPLRS